MTATNSSDMSTEVNTIESCADIVVQNQVLSTSTDQGNKTDGQRKPTKLYTALLWIRTTGMH